MERKEDAGLIVRCKQGSREAFDEFVRKYHRQVFNVAYRMLEDYDEANDIAQDVFVRVYRAMHGFRVESSVFTWLYRITINLCKNRLKVLQRERVRLSPLDDPVETEEGEVTRQIAGNTETAPETLEKKERAHLLGEALKKLGSDMKEIIVLRDMQGLEYEEISRILDINVGTVKSRLHNARMALKGLLQGVLE